MMREDRSQALSIFGNHDYLLRFWDDLSEDEKSRLVHDFKSFDIETFQNEIEFASGGETLGNLTPIDHEHHAVAAEIDETTMRNYCMIGLKAIAEKKVAAVVLAGGQASRLGGNVPKGTVQLGFDLPEQYNTLLSIQMARIARLQQMAKEAFPNSSPSILWIVMVSESTRYATIKHIESLSCLYGIFASQVIYLCQNEVPCFDEVGKLMLSSKGVIATAPNGNGGFYSSVSSLIPLLRQKRIHYFHVYCVDNILCRVADPYFLGYCITVKADCATKVIEKIDPRENLGVVCRGVDGVRVVEYSEIPLNLAEKRDETNRLLFRAGSIANHFFSFSFLEQTNRMKLPYHRAHKKVRYMDNSGVLVNPESPNAYKLELFIFDMFKYSKNFHVWEVCREQEFSPLKNADSVGTECIKTCRRDFSAEARRWLINAGAVVNGNGEIFISPCYSYCGENLNHLDGHTVQTPCVLTCQLSARESSDSD